MHHACPVVEEFCYIFSEGEEDVKGKSIQPIPTPDPGYYGKVARKKTSHTNEPRGQPFPSR